MTFETPVAFSFRVELIGHGQTSDAHFQEVSGLSSETEIEQIEEGGENRFVHRLPGRIEHPNLVLKRGIVLTDDPLMRWCRESMESDLAKPIETKDLTLSLLNEDRSPVMVWQVSHAWPVKWAIDQFDAMKNEASIETIELAYQDVTREVSKIRPRLDQLS